MTPLTPERAARLLRAKNGELEAWALKLHDLDAPPPLYELVADVALIAELLADVIERQLP